METKVVSYTDKSGKEYRVIVGEQTAIARLRRVNMRGAGVQVKDADQDMHILRLVLYPDCIAPVVDWCGAQKPTFEEFALLPGEFVDAWAIAVWELIPEWEPKAELTPEETAVVKAEDVKKQ